MLPKPVLVLFATREGHSARVADHIAKAIEAQGGIAGEYNAAHLPESFSLRDFAKAFLIASVHGGEHESELLQFARQHREELGKLSAVFLSVSLSEMSAEDPKADPELRARAKSEVDRAIDSFVQETNWHPTRVLPVAGALSYVWTSAHPGTSTDSFTDWAVLDRFVAEVMSSGLP